MLKVNVPLSVAPNKREEYRQNYHQLTGGTGRLLLIAADQKIEHLNTDFFGAGIAPEDSRPEHIFKIAAESRGGVLASHLGLIARYGSRYPRTPYLIKLNGKTNLGNNDEKDSSKLWLKIEDVVKFKKQSGLKIVGIGYTLYLGGRYEAKMLAKIAKTIYEAHQHGLTAVLWIYPRGPRINEDDIHTIAGGAGVAACLDADFVKVKYPYGAKNKTLTAKNFQEVTAAAGETKVICVGGSKRPTKEIIEQLERQIKISQTAGLAFGRNLHQRTLPDAVRLLRALEALIFHNATSATALKIYSQPDKEKTKKNRGFLGIF
jgi:fructose-bisphosphate aldolase/6-deoxy-5-ketofructose 1-phosphate synthase